MSLFDPQTNRLPNHYPWAEEFIKAMHNGFWTADEFNFISDKSQFYSELTPEEQQMVIRTLAAISQIEIAVKSFWARLGDNLPHPYIKDLGIVMANSEVIHNNAYEKLLRVMGMEDEVTKAMEVPAIKDRVDYLTKYTKEFSGDERQQYLYSIILFTLFIENISLFSQFYIVSALNRFRSVLKDTANQVRYTRNEETIHSQVGIRIINTIREELPELFDQALIDRVFEEAQVALEAESKVIDWIVGDYRSDQIDPYTLKQYILSRINASMEQIGFKPLEPHDSSIDSKVLWLEEETLAVNSTDFFHTRPVEYSRGDRPFDATDLFD